MVDVTVVANRARCALSKTFTFTDKAVRAEHRVNQRVTALPSNLANVTISLANRLFFLRGQLAVVASGTTEVRDGGHTCLGTIVTSVAVNTRLAVVARLESTHSASSCNAESFRVISTKNRPVVVVERIRTDLDKLKTTD